MAVWREAGQLICQCADPVPRRVELFGGYECRRCWKLITRCGPELLRRRAELAEQRSVAS
jgi:hypothetical protein